MNVLKRGRFLYWLAAELSAKYTMWLVFGFVIGLAASLALGRLLPIIGANWFSPVERIGIIGEFTPTTLPSSIQKEISTGLTEVSDDGSAKPALASSWQMSDDGKTYIFTLRKDFLWHNGKPVLASNVNYNIKNVVFQSTGAYTLKVSLQEPYSPFPTLLTKPILQAGLLGFGPYKVTGIRLNGDKVVYLKLVPVANSTLAAREYRFYRTEALAIIGYKLGDIDVLADVSTLGEEATWGKTTVIKRVKSDRVVALFFNLKDPLLGEKSFRQALGYGLPIISEERAFSPIAKTSWAYADKIRHYVPDGEHAQKLLVNSETATSGATLTITTFSQYVDTAQAIANSWNKLGVKTNIKIENAITSQYQVLLSAQDIPPDPDQYPFWHSTQTATNITGYSNLKIDKLLEDGRKELDVEKRKKIYADFQRFLVEDAPAIFLYNAPVYTIKRSKGAISL